MDDEQPLKGQLPSPYDQDLSGRLRHLNRRTVFGRNRAANDPVTAAYLCAAMRLVKRHLGPGAEPHFDDPNDENSIKRPLLGFLSQRQIADEVANNPAPFPRVGSQSNLRDKWETASDFIADLLSFALWSEHYPPDYDEQVAKGAERLCEGPDFVETIHDLAFVDTAAIIGLEGFRLQLAAAAAADGDNVIKEVISDYYRTAGDPWKQVYAAFIEARGLRLRTGFTLDQFADIIAALAEGVTVRAISDPSVEMIDYTGKRSLLGTGGLAVLLGCLERADSFSGLTLEQATHRLVYGEGGAPAAGTE